MASLRPVASRLTLAAVAGLAGAFLAPGASPAQTGSYGGMQAGVAFRATSLTGGGFPHDEHGLGVRGGARYLWPSGFSLGMGASYGQPEDLSLPGDDPRRTMERIGVHAQARYEVQKFGHVRPYAGVRAGWTTLRSENVDDVDGSGVMGGIVLGTQVRATDRLAFELSAVSSAFRVPGFAGSESGHAWSLEAGLSYFFGEVFESLTGTSAGDGGTGQ